MSDISLVNGVTGGRVETDPVERQRTPVRVDPEPRASDRAEISDRARLLSRLSALPDVRANLVADVRRRIADGTYETADRLDQAVASMLDDLDIQN